MNDENIEFSNACYEVLEILKHIKKEDIDKIPEDDINMLKKNANYNHNFTYNPDISIREQKVLKLTKGIIAMFFEKYIASPTNAIIKIIPIINMAVVLLKFPLAPIFFLTYLNTKLKAIIDKIPDATISFIMKLKP